MCLPRNRALPLVAACAALASILPVTAANAASPEIRTSTANAVPACVTPRRLMAFLKTHNRRLDPRYANIAAWYEHHGEAWHVRWDYAFFQMAVETNFLTYKRGDGGSGDVNPRQNNFAGLGTTGGGVPGDSYPDVGTGVLAQIQHLVVYSGQHIDQPVGARTKLKQDDIIENVARFKGRTTFADLARRWAADRHYGKSIEWVAGRYRAAYCTGTDARAKTDPEPLRPAAPHLVRSGLGGPKVVTRVADATPPVRTIWSRSQQEAPAAQAPAAKAPEPPQAPAMPETPVKAQRPAPVPQPVPAEAEKPAVVAAPPAAATPASATGTRAPTVTAAPDPITKPITTRALVVSTQSEIAAPAPTPTPPAEATPQAAAPVPTAAEEDPRAFGFAAAMNAAMQTKPAPQPVAVAGTGTAQCRVMEASFGGDKTLLVRAEASDEVRYTALTVLDGFEKSMLASFLKEHAPGGTNVGSFATKEAAIDRARALCSGAAEAKHGKRANAG